MEKVHSPRRALMQWAASVRSRKVTSVKPLAKWCFLIKKQNYKYFKRIWRFMRLIFRGVVWYLMDHIWSIEVPIDREYPDKVTCQVFLESHSFQWTFLAFKVKKIKKYALKGQDRSFRMWPPTPKFFFRNSKRAFTYSQNFSLIQLS